MSDRASLEIRSATFRYDIDGTAAVDDVCLAVEAGERVAILGESGSGKSTLLHLLSGIVRPSQGKILLNGREVSTVSPVDRHFALVLQRPPFMPGITVTDLALRPARRDRSESDAKQITESVLRDLQLQDFAQRRLSDLSGGQAQRAHLARVLVWNPKFALLDEPFNSLDVQLRHDIYPLIRKHQLASKSALVLVTHDPLEAVHLCDRIVLLSKGRVLSDMSAHQLLAEPPVKDAARLIGGFAANLVGVTSTVRKETVATVQTPFGELRGTFVPSRPGVGVPEQAIGLFQWRDITALPVSEAYVSQPGQVFKIENVGATSENIPGIYSTGELAIYGLPYAGKAQNVVLRFRAKTFLLYSDQKEGSLLGRLNIVDSH